MRHYNVIADRESDEYQTLRRRFLTEYLQALEGQQQRNNGYHVDSPLMPEALTSLGRKDPSPVPDDDLGMTLDALLTAWVTERGSNEKTILAVRSTFEEFKTITRQSYAKAVTKAVAVAYKDALLCRHRGEEAGVHTRRV